MKAIAYVLTIFFSLNFVEAKKIVKNSLATLVAENGHTTTNSTTTGKDDYNPNRSVTDDDDGDRGVRNPKHSDTDDDDDDTNTADRKKPNKGAAKATHSLEEKSEVWANKAIVDLDLQKFVEDQKIAAAAALGVDPKFIDVLGPRYVAARQGLEVDFTIKKDYYPAGKSSKAVAEKIESVIEAAKTENGEARKVFGGWVDAFSHDRGGEGVFSLFTLAINSPVL